MELYFLWAAALLGLLISALVNKQKTAKALTVAGKKLSRILPAFIEMLILVSIALTLVPRSTIIKYAGGSGPIPTLLATVFGSVAMMPGFIAFPLSGVLLERGASYTTLAAFTTTLMMVGVVTFPVEREYFGTWLAVVRNIIKLAIALLVAVAIGLAYGELI